MEFARGDHCDCTFKRVSALDLITPMSATTQGANSLWLYSDKASIITYWRESEKEDLFLHTLTPWMQDLENHG